jgi:excinuclease ABC subunit B
VAIYYDRNDIDFRRGTFRVRGDTLDVHPAYRDTAYPGRVLGRHRGSHHRDRPADRRDPGGAAGGSISSGEALCDTQDRLTRPCQDIEAELEARLAELRAQDKLLEAQRLEQRTLYDLEMMRRSATAAASRTTRGT